MRAFTEMGDAKAFGLLLATPPPLQHSQGNDYTTSIKFRKGRGAPGEGGRGELRGEKV